MRNRWKLRLLVLLLLLGPVLPAAAQMPPGGPPVVGVAIVHPQEVTASSQFVGRVQAIGRVAIVARVTAFLDQQFFTEGSEVQKGALLYRLERAPFLADVEAKQAAVAQQQALLRNATIVLNRARTLLNTPAGQRSTVDDAIAQQASIAAQLQAAEAQLKASEINLGYTEIRAPIAGKIGRSLVTVGNVVSPSSGALVSIVSQDPMYVLFPVSVREALDLRDRYERQGGFAAAVVTLTLPQGGTFRQRGRIDYIDPSVAQDTDTLTLRATFPNPMGNSGFRELVDGEFVTVMVDGAHPTLALAIPRAAVLMDQQGDYVFVVGAGDKVEQRRITLGQSTPAEAIVTAGLTKGESVVTDGIQRVHPGMVVKPVPAGAPAGAGK
jgi:membrane fusion protein (multidrug efflux system)